MAHFTECQTTYMHPLSDYVSPTDFTLCRDGKFDDCESPIFSLALSKVSHWLDIGECTINAYTFNEFSGLGLPKINAVYLCAYMYLFYNSRDIYSADLAAGALTPLATCWVPFDGFGDIKQGRCRMSVDGGKKFAYIVAQKALYGDTAPHPAYQYHHRCGRPMCYRPSHIEPVLATFNQSKIIKTCPGNFIYR